MRRRSPPPHTGSSACAMAVSNPRPMRARLFERVILRRLINEPLRSLTTTLGIALGVAVVVAIQLTNASSLRGFETALNTVSGRAALELIGAGVGIDETVLADLGWLRQYGDVAPLIEGED